jgi:PAS domain S-box-containing protein
MTKSDTPSGIFSGSVLDSIPDAVVVTDIKGIVAVWNAAAVELFRWTQQDAAGRHIDELVTLHSENGGISYQDAVNGKAIRGLECSGYGRELEDLRRVSVSYAPLNENGTTTGSVIVYTSLSERDSILDSIRENDIKFRALTESAQDAVIIIDADSRISFFNKSAELMFGYSREEALGRKLFQLIAPEPYWEMIEIGFRQFKKNGTGMMLGRVVEIEGRRKNGNIFPVELSVSSFFLNGGWQATGILRDISERKGIELELIKAREEALNAARIKSEFLTNMSHEIRTPLNAIIGTCDLLKQTDLSPVQKNYLRVNTDASEHLLHIINDILDISKAEAGRIELEKIVFDIFEEVETACRTMSFKAHRKKLEINCRIRPDTPRWVVGDPSRLKQILFNLVGNAIKFTSEGEIDIDVKPESPGRIAFTVTDTGIGIPEDKVEAVFRSFTQGDSSHTRRYGGTGLGLAICTRLARLMGGDISVESTEGSGSTFSFSCKLPEVDQEFVSEDNHGWPLDLSGKHILLADDNHSNRVAVEELLQNWGASVDFTTRGSSVVEMVAAVSYDVILLNSTVNDLEGCEIVDSLNRESTDISRIIMMLPADNSCVERCSLKGVHRFVFKPPARTDLAVQISEVFRKPETSSEPAVSPSVEADTVDNVEKMELSILLAEDSPDNVFLMKKYLEPFPWKLTVAGNGQEALHRFLKQKFDIILMDMQMPVMDGYEATKSIRAHEHISGSQRTPIVALTAHSLDSEIKKCIDAGCNIHISKPVRKTILIEKLKELMNTSVLKVEE